MMPAVTAKRCIADLRQMRLEIAYEKAGRVLNRGRVSTPATSPVKSIVADGELAPGETRKRIGNRNDDVDAERFDLRDLGDQESEDENENENQQSNSDKDLFSQNLIRPENSTQDQVNRYEKEVRLERELEKRRKRLGNNDDDEEEEELINYNLQRTSKPRNGPTRIEDYYGNQENELQGSQASEADERMIWNRDDYGKDFRDEMSDGDEALEVNESWWTKPPRNIASRNRRLSQEDDVDRMLQRTTGNKRSRKDGRPRYGISAGTSNRRSTGIGRPGAGGGGNRNGGIRRAAPTHPRSRIRTGWLFKKGLSITDLHRQSKKQIPIKTYSRRRRRNRRLVTAHQEATCQDTDLESARRIHQSLRQRSSEDWISFPTTFSSIGKPGR